MKNIFKSILALSLVFSFTSCEDEQDLLFSQPEGEFKILSPVSGEGVVLSPDTPLNPGLSMTWEAANYGSPTEITYTIQVDKSGDEFDSPIDVVSTTNTYATVSSDALNSAAVAAGLTPFTQGGLEVRLRSTVGTTGSQEQFSDVISYLVTPYSTELPKLAVPGNHQGWNPPTAPRIASSAFGETDYEGYIWLDGGFKFVGPDPAGNYNWGNTDWGDDGTFSGALAESGESDCTATAGYYRVRANTETLVYSVEPTTWGIVGAATPGSWDNSTALTYNSTTKKWEGTVVMTAGEFKFRANNAWAINLGGDPDEDGSMNYDGPNLSVSAAGTYSVVLDLSNPRQYSYTVTLQ
ncbi:SusE domain-containing protein [Flavobacterium sp.]|uniref:SusE domain-containing protein n=1 Tax=Flavobacterium sp. TaxID=239 RepID=UPI002B4B32FB|nr:SusE domain-containing protein [Flavobacterium sp.]HLP65331.1 SusE domain-containing protein [Flavobacterium sp.]